MHKQEIPKKIWLFWSQGWDAAPRVVEDCARSWERHNPDWEVVRLDAQSMSAYIDMSAYDDSRIFIQAYADIARIKLLQTHGGVWADATCFCTKPLNGWLPTAAATGFFAYRRTHADKDLAIWCMAAYPGNVVIERWAAAVEDFWQRGGLVSAAMIRLYHKLYHLCVMPYVPRLGQRWLRFAKRVFGVYPYAWPTYLFQELYRTDDVFAAGWDAVAVVDAAPALVLWRHDLAESLRPETCVYIDTHTLPVHKLKHTLPDVINDGSAYAYLLRYSDT